MTRTTRLILLAAVMLAGTGSAAHALPFLGIAVAFASGAAAAVSLGASLLVAGLVGAGYAALSYVAQSALGKRQEAVQSYSKMQTGGTVPQSFIFGTRDTPGSLVYFNYWGQDGKTPNAYESRVTALSDLPSTALMGLIVDDRPCTYGSGSPDPNLGYPIPEFDKEGKHYLWVKFYDGTQVAADPFLVSKFATDPQRPYAATRVGKGRTYAVVTIRNNDQNLTSSSTIKFIVKGAKWYDPTKDTSVGGFGAHRFNDPSTWEYSENPQVIRYNIRRGVYYGTQWMFGVQGMHPSRLPFDNWAAAIAECSTLVAKNEGGTEPQYRCGGEASLETEPAALDESLMRACNARSIEVGGVYKTITGPAPAATKSYTDADFIITTARRYNPYPGLSGTVNGITGKWPDPAQNWKPSDAPARLDDDLMAIDGNRRAVADINYDCVPFGEQVQRNMLSALDEERRWRTHDVVWPHTEWENEPGDTFLWTSPRNGYLNKLFRIESLRLLKNRDIAAVVREVDPASYDYNPETQFIPIPIGSLVPNPIPSQAVSGSYFEGIEIVGDGGRKRAGGRAHWNPVDVDDVDGVIIEVRRAEDGSVVWQGESPHSIELFQAGYTDFEGGLVSNTNYEGRFRYRPVSNRPTDWTNWLAFTTPDVRFTSSELVEEIIARAQLDVSLRRYLDFVGASLDARLKDIREISQAVAEVGLGASSDIQEVRKSLTSTTGKITANYTEAITIATGPNSAIVQAQHVLEVAMLGLENDLTATVELVETQTVAIEALDDSVTLVSASVLEMEGRLNNPVTGLTAVYNITQSQAGTIVSQGNTIAIQGAAITDINLTLAGFSPGTTVASATLALASSITALGGDVDAQSDLIAALDTTVGRFSASGRFRVATAAGINGGDASAAISVAVNAGGASYDAGMWLNARTDGANHRTEVLLKGSLVGIMDDSGTVQALFTSGGAVLRTALIGDATIGTLKLENGAVMDPQVVTGINTSWNGFTGGSWDITGAVSASKDFTGTGFVTVDFSGAVSYTGSASGIYQLISCVRSDGTTITGSIVLRDFSHGGGGAAAIGKFFDTSPLSGSRNYKLRISTLTNPAGSTNLTITGNMLVTECKK